MDVDAVAVEGAWWRQTPHGGDPLFRASPPSDGRWQRGDVVGGIYFADTEQTAWAEWYRALAEFAIPPDRQMPRDLWRWDVAVDRVADLSTADRLAAVGLPAPRPTQREWLPFQEVGERPTFRTAGSPRRSRFTAMASGRPKSIPVHVAKLTTNRR